MPRAIALDVREEIVRCKEQERMPLTLVARALSIGVSTARGIWRRYRNDGADGLRPHYDRCVHKGPRCWTPIYDAAMAMRQEHPYWGGQFIQIQLTKRFPEQKVPSARTLQRWFRQSGLQRLRSKPLPQPKARAQEAHETWQMDAKEQIVTQGGEGHSLLDIVDEASGAQLAGALFPPQPLDASHPGGSARGVAWLL